MSTWFGAAAGAESRDVYFGLNAALRAADSLSVHGTAADCVPS